MRSNRRTPKEERRFYATAVTLKTFKIKDFELCLFEKLCFPRSATGASRSATSEALRINYVKIEDLKFI